MIKEPSRRSKQRYWIKFNYINYNSSLFNIVNLSSVLIIFDNSRYLIPITKIHLYYCVDHYYSSDKKVLMTAETEYVN